MPPAQCPDCGRFLAKDFITGLAGGPSPCPKCGTQLAAAQFAEPPGGPAAEEENTTTADPAVDPLAGWDDPGGEVDESAALRASAPPPDAAILAGAGVFGGVLGALLARRRILGAVVGFIAGLGAAGAARRVWRGPG